ncbi:sulfotransferase family 2 domain-containing protein [Alkalilimnicola ehrlichii]|nr:sulfotransferase family 2 domain-containing protein [Alkalilimnicola ehrlichii]
MDRQQGFIYFRIPKAANSTICATLYPKSNRNSVDKRTAKRYFARGRSLTADEIKHLASRFFLFSFVRNPYTRTASAYLDKVKRNTKTQNLIRQRLKLPGEEPVSFLTFFQYLTAGGLYDNAHWYPQTTFIPCGTKTLSFLGRVENINEDLESVLMAINNKRKPDLILRAEHRTGANDRLLDLYCHSSLNLVNTIYDADFDNLGYKKVDSLAGINLDSSPYNIEA